VFLLFGFAFLFLICSPFLISIFCVFSPLSLLFSMGRFVLALCAGALCWRFVLALCAVCCPVIPGRRYSLSF